MITVNVAQKVEELKEAIMENPELHNIRFIGRQGLGLQFESDSEEEDGKLIKKMIKGSMTFRFLYTSINVK